MGTVSFADDIELLTQILKTLVSICEQYANEYDIRFNYTKSKYMVYKCRNGLVYHQFEDVYVNQEMVEQLIQLLITLATYCQQLIELA